MGYTYKRHREQPRRGIKIWAMDVSKQVVSTGVGHLSGMLWSFLMQRMTSQSASECAWYFIMFTNDTTIGVAVAYFLHTKIVKFAQKKGRPGTCLYHQHRRCRRHHHHNKDISTSELASEQAYGQEYPSPSISSP